jgi:hypothetical protein
MIYAPVLPRHGIHAAVRQQLESRDAHAIFRKWRELPELMPLHSMVTGFVCYQMFWPIGTFLPEDPLEVVLFDTTWRRRRLRKLAEAVARIIGITDTFLTAHQSLAGSTYGDWLVNLRAAVGAR